MTATDGKVETPLRSAEAWCDYLASKPLPQRRSTVARLKRLLDKPGVSLNEIGKLIEGDPAFTVNIIRMAQPLRQPDQAPVARIDYALGLLGFDNITRLPSKLATIALNPTNMAQISFFRALAASEHAATQAAFLCNRHHLPHAMEIELAALCYGVAHWMLWLYAPLHKNEFQYAVCANNQPPQTAEKEIFGCTVMEIGHALAARWGLPQLTIDALDPATQPSNTQIRQLQARHAGEEMDEEVDRQLNHLVHQPTLTIQLANRFAYSTSRGWYSSRTAALVKLIAAYLDLPLNDTRARLHSECANAAREYHIPGTLAPAAEMLLLPSKETLPFALTAPEMETYRRHYPLPESMRMKSEARPASKNNDPQPRDAERLQQALRRFLATTTIKPRPTVILQELIDALYEGLGLERVVLWILDNKSMRLTPARAMGFAGKHPLPLLKVSASQGLLNQLCQRPGAIQLSASTRSQYLPQLPKELQQVLPSNDCLLMSIFRDQQPIAVIYADRGERAKPIHSFYYERFRFLCKAANQALKGGADKP